MVTTQRVELEASADYAAFQSELIRTAADLSRLSAQARAIGKPALAERADERLDHLAGGAFVVALVGEFKRGKSTLANALLGTEVMPADVNPATATINRVVYGREPRVTLCLRNGETRSIPIEALADYVTKLTTESSERAAGIVEARIEFPTRLCLNNVQLLDTPGLGDEAAMTERTLAILPRIDAALMVTSALSPLATTELRILDDLVRHVDRARIFLVVNQIDLIRPPDHPRVLRLVADRATAAIDGSVRLFAVSAREAVLAKLAKDGPRLEASGFPVLEDALEQFLVRDSGVARLQAANETLEVLALAIGEHADAALKDIEKAEAKDQEQLTTLEERLEALRLDVTRWGEKAVERTEASHAVAHARIEKLAGRLTEVLEPALLDVSFTENDLSSPEARHTKVQEACDGPLTTEVASVVQASVKQATAWVDAELSDLLRFEWTLDALLAQDLPGRATSATATVPASATRPTSPETLAFIGDALAPIEETRTLFELSYVPEALGDLLNSTVGRVLRNEKIRGMWDIFAANDASLRKATSDVSRRLREGYGGHLQREIVKKLEAIALADRLVKAYQAIAEKLASKAEGAVKLIDRVTGERKWALRLQREQLHAERARATERMSTTLATAAGARAAAGKRRLILRALLETSVTAVTPPLVH